MKRKRLKALIAEIEAHPERHNQSHWIYGLNERWETFNEVTNTHIPERVKEYEGQLISCGTTGCLAGLGSLRYAPVGTKFWADYLVLPDEEYLVLHTYSEYGAEVFGLTHEEGRYLFAGWRSLEEIVAFSDMNKRQRMRVING